MYHLSSNIKTHQSAKLIYNALCKIILEKDYTTITITELVERVGVGRVTFYRLFDSIRDVLQYRCDAAFIELRESITNYRISIRLLKPTNSTGLLKPLLHFWYLDSVIIKSLLRPMFWTYYLTALIYYSVVFTVMQTKTFIEITLYQSVVVYFLTYP